MRGVPDTTAIAAAHSLASGCYTMRELAGRITLPRRAGARGVRAHRGKPEPERRRARRPLRRGYLRLHGERARGASYRRAIAVVTAPIVALLGTIRTAPRRGPADLRHPVRSCGTARHTWLHVHGASRRGPKP